MEKRPAISIIMTAYNSGEYVEEAVRSLLAQDFEDFELVVVNDGSKDDTGTILDRMAKEDARLRVFHQINMGICAASNFAVSKTRSDVIARMDSDDVAHPDRLGKQLAYMREHNLSCLGTYVEFIDHKGRLLTAIKSPLEHDVIQETLMRGHCCIWHSSAMFTREVFDKAGGYDEDFDCSVDIDLWLRMGEVGTLGNIPECLQQYRMHLGSVSSRGRSKQRDRGREACERAARRRGVACKFTAHEDWRPGNDRESRFTYALRFGWWAFNSGEQQTAALYGLKAIGLHPWSLRGWRLLGSALLKPRRKGEGVTA
ncbi:MAG: glycosyltransferase family 2 protein [Planctomycetota bacterium]